MCIGSGAILALMTGILCLLSENAGLAFHSACAGAEDFQKIVAVTARG
jgi:hypothetical protein